MSVCVFSVRLLFLFILRPPKTYKMTIWERFGIDLLWFEIDFGRIVHGNLHLLSFSSTGMFYFVVLSNTSYFLLKYCSFNFCLFTPFFYYTFVKIWLLFSQPFAWRLETAQPSYFATPFPTRTTSGIVLCRFVLAILRPVAVTYEYVGNVFVTIPRLSPCMWHGNFLRNLVFGSSLGVRLVCFCQSYSVGSL